MKELSTSAQEAHIALRKVQQQGLAGIWSGPAADVWVQQLDKIPVDLKKVAESYSDAASAVALYSGRVKALQGEAQGLLGRAQAAQSESFALTSERIALSNRIAQLEAQLVSLTRMDVVDEARRAFLESEIRKARWARTQVDTKIDKAESKLRLARSKAEELAAEQAAAARDLNKRLLEASRLGLAAAGWLAGLRDWVVDAVDRGTKFLRDVLGEFNEIVEKAMPVLVGGALLLGLAAAISIGGPVGLAAVGKAAAVALPYLKGIHLTHLMTRGAHDLLTDGKLSVGLMLEGTLTAATHGLGGHARRAIPLFNGLGKSVVPFSSSRVIRETITIGATHVGTDLSRRAAPDLWNRIRIDPRPFLRLHVSPLPGVLVIRSLVGSRP